MLIEEVAKLMPMERLLYWIQERESIRLKRKDGKPPPWTDDEILRKYRFCNVRRMDDRVSQWLLNNWYKPNYGHPNMLIACALARQFNVPEALHAIGFPKVWNPSMADEILNDRHSLGLKNFSAAYMITGIYGGSKVTQVIYRFIMPLVNAGIVIDTRTMQKSWTMIQGMPGFRSFLAGQVVADLRWAVEGQWADRNTWAPMGPGSRRGMNRLLGLNPKSPMSQDQFEKHLTWYIEVCESKLPSEVYRRLEAIDWQNILCETDKFSRVLLGEGKPKQLYRTTE
ncbi:putative DNA base hypermodification protein [Candidatus Pacearchaeota archaeon]|jgi:hypothetical protein|nr:putative DNA base hypermodification protein [Candidatus Pacearchaeota archaeon]